MAKNITKITALSIFTIVLTLATIMSALAWESYDGIVNPYTVNVGVDLSTVGNVPVDVKLCNLRTGYCVSQRTNAQNRVQFELSEFKVRDAYEMPWQGRDNLEITYCGLAEGCKYSFSIGESKEGVRCCKGPVVLELKGPLASVPKPEPVVEPVEEPKLSALELCKKDPVCSIQIVKKDGVDVLPDGSATAEELAALKTKYRWAMGLIAALVVLAGLGGAWAVKSRKALKTIVSKDKAGSYKKG